MINFPIVVYSTAIVSPSMITADSTGKDMWLTERYKVPRSGTELSTDFSTDLQLTVLSMLFLSSNPPQYAIFET